MLEDGIETPYLWQRLAQNIGFQGVGGLAGGLLVLQYFARPVAQIAVSLDDFLLGIERFALTSDTCACSKDSRRFFVDPQSKPSFQKI